MEITKVQDISFNTQESVITASISTANELVLLMSSGRVYRFYTEQEEFRYLFSVKSSLRHSDGCFDINAPSTIYTLDSIVVIVNDYKRHGFVHYPGKYTSLHLWREDYHADISRYPIALFNNEVGIPHLIYGEAWNHVQIMNLDTRQILTASKSLIEEGAEENHIKFYQKHKEDSKLVWPRPYNYFYGRLEMSPQKKHFLSAGWVWGSFDACHIYEVDHFINSNRIADRFLDALEHLGRAVCWLDEETIIVAYNPFQEGDEGAIEESKDELHFYTLTGKGPEIHSKIYVPKLDLVNSKIYYSQKLNVIIVLAKKEGVAVLSLDGEILFRDERMKQDAYDPDLNLFIKTDHTSVSIYKVST